MEIYANHGMYINQVARVTNENLAAGYIVWEDADATKAQAAESGVGETSPAATMMAGRVRIQR